MKSTERKRHGLAGFAVRRRTAPSYVYRLAAILKLGGRCILCGTRDFRVLEINHVNGETDYLRVACGEVSGLEVRCANCSVIHEFERGNKKLLSVMVNPTTGHLTKIGKSCYLSGFSSIQRLLIGPLFPRTIHSGCCLVQC